MIEARDLNTDEEVDAALSRAQHAPPRALAVSAEYNRELDIFVLRLNNGHRLVIQRENLMGLESATPDQLADIEIFAGVNIGWRQLDVDHYLPYLLEGKYATDRWKQSRKQHQVAA